MKRAYSLLEIKSFDDDKRIITGIATTPEPDLMEDEVAPKGVEFKLPIPFLWQHDTTQPIGHVTKAKVTKDGIEVEVHIAKLDEPATLKNQLDECWAKIRAGLVRGLSIGFKELESEPIKGTSGLRFLRWIWLELSAVTIAANQAALITTIKQIDNALLAATGHKQDDVDRSTPPGASGKKPNPVVKAEEAKTMSKKTIAEQISAFEATRQAKAARMTEIMEAAGEKGETLDAPQKEEYDTLDGEVNSVDEHLVRLRALEKSNIAAAVSVRGNDPAAASESRAGVVATTKRNVEKGIIFTRLLGAKYLAFKHGVSPIEVARSKFGDTPEVELILRAPIAAMNTTDASSAAPLVELQNAVGEFLELLRPKTIIDRIPGLRRVPFNIKVGRGLGDPTAYWVGEGKVKPVSNMTFDQVTLAFAKVAGIVAQTEELMRFSQPSSERLVRDGLVSAVAYLVDRDFLDPAKAANDVSPASITNGVTPITASGTTADALRADLGTLLDEYEDDNMGGDSLVIITTSKLAGRIALMRNTLGNREFEGLTRLGGTLEGIPVITSQNIVSTGGSPADGGLIVAVNASSILVADDGGVDIDISREASLQMESAPDSPATASTVLVSLWQHNMVAIKAERFINWKKGRDGAVQFIQNAKYA